VDEALVSVESRHAGRTRENGVRILFALLLGLLHVDGLAACAAANSRV
jgi:hypothetical protein